MFTIRLERKHLENGPPYAVQSYSVLHAEAYFVNREPAPVLPGPDEANGPTKYKGWRTRIEMATPKNGGEYVTEYLGEGQMYERAFVMNDSGKTVDTLG